VKVAIRLGYEASIDQARAVLLAMTEGDDRIVPEPAAAVGLSQLADDAMYLTLGFWIVDESVQKSMESEYLEKAKNALDAAGIQVPGKRMDNPQKLEVGGPNSESRPLLAA
jgi:small conductance mechanosensitive channel